MQKLTFILVSFALFLCVRSQDQLHPLCGTDPALPFVDDPSSCHGYLYCRWNETATPPTIISVHQIDCRNQGSNHYDPDTNTCVDLRDAKCDTDLLFFCSTGNNIMIANHTDPTCTQYRPCRLPGMPWMECRSPLVFNRNTGACDFEEIAPCGDIFNDANCPIGGTGNFPGQRCWTFIFCFNGDQIGSEFECPGTWWFNPETNECEDDTAGVCIRPTYDFVPPVVPNRVSKKQKKEINIKIEV